MIKGYKWVMHSVKEPLKKEEVDFVAGDGNAIVQVEGCGICHTDISFWWYGVPTRKKPPLTLGHEISGVVVSGKGEGKKVVIPSVMGCGQCELCSAGRTNVCLSQKMPGNDIDGGFASHVVVPEKHLVYVPESLLEKAELWKLSVIADAISTPYQAMKRAELKKGELAIVNGVGVSARSPSPCIHRWGVA